jgi:hypothetical protein
MHIWGGIIEGHLFAYGVCLPSTMYEECVSSYTFQDYSKKLGNAVEVVRIIGFCGTYAEIILAIFLNQLLLCIPARRQKHIVDPYNFT